MAKVIMSTESLTICTRLVCMHTHTHTQEWKGSTWVALKIDKKWKDRREDNGGRKTMTSMNCMQVSSYQRFKKLNLKEKKKP